MSESILFKSGVYFFIIVSHFDIRSNSSGHIHTEKDETFWHRGHELGGNKHLHLTQVAGR